jgi:ATP-grasp domain, R2K clade family 3
VLRDYVKSMKHYWHEAAYIPDTADHAAAWKIAARFRELREEEFTGGFVLRQFEELTSAEARTWWVSGTCRLFTAHPDTPGDLPPDIDLTPFTPLIRLIGSEIAADSCSRGRAELADLRAQLSGSRDLARRCLPG